MRIVAFVDDLMDRSKLTAALPGITFLAEVHASVGADVVIIDLGRHPDFVAVARQLAPEARIVAFGSHVDDGALTTARTAGADQVLPRSRFFRDPSAAVNLGN